MATKWKYKVPITSILARNLDPEDAGQRIADKLRDADVDEDVQEALGEFAERFEGVESEGEVNTILRELYAYGDEQGVYFGDRKDEDRSDKAEPDEEPEEEEDEDEEEEEDEPEEVKEG
jgi:stringent starvation protein B